MAYCTRQNLIDAFGLEELIQLTDKEFASDVNEDVLNKAIAASQAEIDIWLAGSYKLPLPEVPQVLVRMACDMTRYILAGDVLDDHPIAVRWRDQLVKLKAIASGKASLGLDNLNVQTERVDLVQIAAGRNDFGDRSKW